MTGQEIRAKRLTLQMTQAQLGEALRVNKNTIARWERDELTPQSTEMLRLAFIGLEMEHKPALTGKKLARKIERSTNKIRRIARRLSPASNGGKS